MSSVTEHGHVRCYDKTSSIAGLFDFVCSRFLGTDPFQRLNFDVGGNGASDIVLTASFSKSSASPRLALLKEALSAMDRELQFLMTFVTVRNTESESIDIKCFHL